MFGITFPAKITRVIDGDTLEVEVRRTIRIRLLNCDAYESRTRDMQEKIKGLKSKDYLSQLALGKDATVIIPIDEGGKFGDSMTFGRVLGRVEIDEGDLSQLMIDSGHAEKPKKRK